MGREDQETGALVTIRYDGAGNPIADPVELRVKAGTRITWQNASAQDGPFTLDFERRVPQPGPLHRRLEAHREGDRYLASIIATPDPAPSASPEAGASEERYAYQVRSGDRSADPTIIIQR